MINIGMEVECMNGQKRIRDYGIVIGNMTPGERNSITDVAGVRVGHITLDEGDIKTGVTAIIPHEGNMFKEKLVASSHVINGFGKSTGLVQIEELGTLETPIILTNTLSVGTAWEALARYMLIDNLDIGKKAGTVNPVVCECNDGYLNDIRGLHIKGEDIFKAIENANVDFLEGSVGAGRGMVCYDLKGGIGTASRKINLNNREYTIGILVLTNFGSLENLTIDGSKIGKKIIALKENANENKEDKGSIITILATDIPLSDRQLKRVIKRVYPGISRTGSTTGTGSGEIVIGFSTANKFNHYEAEDVLSLEVINENKINRIFNGAAEATEEAIFNSLICADTTTGVDGHIIYSLKEYIDKVL